MNSGNSPEEWNITINIGPILFNMLISSAFFNYSTQQSSERHSHSTFEFHFITEGSGILSTDDCQYKLSKDSYYLVRAGVYHMHKGSDSAPLQRYSCKFEYDITGNSYDNYSEEEIKSFVYILSNTRFFYSEKLSNFKNIIFDIQSELKQRPLGYYTKIQHLFALLFIGILRDIAAETNFELKKQPSFEFKEHRINIIENFFDLKYSYKATSKELCGLLHISSSQLNRILKEKYNMTFKQKHIEIQTEYIKDMLINTNMPIKAIAEKIGYTSEGNFTAFFKHVTGMSPKEYRKEGHKSNKA